MIEYVHHILLNNFSNRRYVKQVKTYTLILSYFLFKIDQKCVVTLKIGVTAFFSAWLLLNDYKEVIRNGDTMAFCSLYRLIVYY